MFCVVKFVKFWGVESRIPSFLLSEYYRKNTYLASTLICEVICNILERKGGQAYNKYECVTLRWVSLSNNFVFIEISKMDPEALSSEQCSEVNH